MISIIVPTHNRHHLLCDSLKSILAQTVRDIEIIVIDGSTNEKTSQLIATFDDPRIKYSKIENLKFPGN